MRKKGHRPNESWFHERIQCDDGIIALPRSEDEIIRILRDCKSFPSPVRPVGSRHSMTMCMSAQAPDTARATKWGTLVDMTNFTTLRDGSGAPGTRSLEVTADASTETGTVTVPAGRTFVDVARELNEKGWMFRVNTELGPLTIGAAACGATKDSSFHRESGQVCHDVVGMRLIRPDGTPVDVGADHPHLPALRCSYGLFGIVTEVTFRVYPKYYISMEHKVVSPENGEAFTPSELQRHFDTWLGPKGNENAVFLYLFPYRNRIVAEIRHKPVAEGDAREKSWRLAIRNHFWDQAAHSLEKRARRFGDAAPPHSLRRRLRNMRQDFFGAGLSWYLTRVLRIARLNPTAQIVEFDPEDDKHRFTFSMWAFDEKDYARILPEYFTLCRKHENTFRSGLPHASYHIGQDRSSLLSYSSDGPVWTLDPICPDKVEGWHGFLDDFNDFCVDHGGVPLLNQTPRLTRMQVARAFNDRLAQFEQTRQQFDRSARMLNAYFAELLAIAPFGDPGERTS